MAADMMGTFWHYGLFALLLFVIGIYMLVASRNLIRILIGLEILIKGVTILLVAAGFASGRLAQVQSLVITLIVLEVVLMAVALAVVLGIRKATGSLDARDLRRLKG